jgi:hypothetical protein
MTRRTKQQLIRYVEDGHLGIDNNITERDIRPFTTGRKISYYQNQSTGLRQAQHFIVS